MSVPGAPIDDPLPSTLPAETPLDMPVQSLRQGRLSAESLPSTPRGMAWRRAYVIGGAASLTLLAAYQIWWVLRGDGISVLEAVLLALFVALFAWIALSFSSTLAGFVLLVSGRTQALGIDEHAPLPVLAMFDWLQGRDAQAGGWRVDLSAHADGRLVARREQPQPAAELRLVFEQP